MCQTVLKWQFHLRSTQLWMFLNDNMLWFYFPHSYCEKFKWWYCACLAHIILTGKIRWMSPFKIQLFLCVKLSSNCNSPPHPLFSSLTVSLGFHVLPNSLTQSLSALLPWAVGQCGLHSRARACTASQSLDTKCWKTCRSVFFSFTILYLWHVKCICIIRLVSATYLLPHSLQITIYTHNFYANIPIWRF